MTKGRPSVGQMHEHVVSLLQEYEIICNRIARPTRAYASFELWEVWIPHIKSPISYVSALHEIGHIMGRHRASRRRMVRERDAWRWAKAHALIWTGPMEKHRRVSLAWYETSIAAGRISPLCKFAEMTERQA
jgi:hypothetical protein